MDFTVGKKLKTGQVLFNNAILMEGEIREGDASRFLQFIKENRAVIIDELLSVVPSSNGGSVSEAIKIAKTIEDGMFAVWLPPNIKDWPDRSKQVRCASSCFLFVVAGASRVIHKETVGLHRPYFDAKVYGAISTATAISAHERLLLEMRAWLSTRGVPASLIEKMMNHSSREIYWMSYDDIQALGAIRPSAEELMIAKCDYDKALFGRWSDAALAKHPSTAEIEKKLTAQSGCTNALVKAARSAFLSTY